MVFLYVFTWLPDITTILLFEFESIICFPKIDTYMLSFSFASKTWRLQTHTFLFNSFLISIFYYQRLQPTIMVSNTFQPSNSIQNGFSFKHHNNHALIIPINHGCNIYNPSQFQLLTHLLRLENSGIKFFQLLIPTAISWSGMWRKSATLMFIINFLVLILIILDKFFFYFSNLCNFQSYTCEFILPTNTNA